MEFNNKPPTKFIEHRSDSIPGTDYIVTPIQRVSGTKIENLKFRYYSANFRKIYTIIGPET